MREGAADVAVTFTHLIPEPPVSTKEGATREVESRFTRVLRLLVTPQILLKIPLFGAFKLRPLQ